MWAQDATRARIGKQNRHDGLLFESLINASCKYYEQNGMACIQKQAEPMKILDRAARSGQFIACFAKKSGPDYSGVLRGGQAVSFEAKYTSTDRIKRSVILEEQERQLNLRMYAGAACFVLVSFRLETFFAVPWSVFRDMSEIYGRKHLRADDIPEYEIACENGILRFLEERE